MSPISRDPVWSQWVTAPLAARIPAEERARVLVAIKAFHTAAFFSIGAMVALFAWDGFASARAGGRDWQPRWPWARH